MTELGEVVLPDVREKEELSVGDEFCHILMEGSDVAYCGHKDEGSPATCKPYAGEAICPSCGLATCPKCALQSALNERLEEM